MRALLGFILHTIPRWYWILSDKSDYMGEEYLRKLRGQK